MSNDAHGPLKSMRLFFLDNQGAWPTDADGTSKARLIGDLVVWPDNGKYPSFVPLAAAKHPAFDGTIVVQGGNRGIVVSFCEGAKNEEQVRAVMSRGKPEQYRIAVDAIVHRILLMRAEDREGSQHDEAGPLPILAWLASSDEGRPYAQVIAAALQGFIANTEQVKKVNEQTSLDAFDVADAMLTTLQQAMVQRGAQANADKVKRR